MSLKSLHPSLLSTLLFLLFLQPYNVQAQLEWMYMQGDTSLNASGNYITLGTPGGAPGARRGAEMVADSHGRLWLFGGAGINGQGTNGRLNDLWMYDPVDEMWTWAAGTSALNQSGIYGSKGVSSATNQPGGRSYFSFLIDESDNLWLIGGHGYDSTGALGWLNDVWTFNTTSGNWTWVKGNKVINSSSVRGTKGVESPLNTIGGTWKMASDIDGQGNIWLYGGYGKNEIAGMGVKNDLWRFNTNTLNWTFIEGSGNYYMPTVNTAVGQYNALNTPGSLQDLQLFVDDSNEVFVFGGRANNPGVPDVLRSIGFSYNINAGMWKPLLPSSFSSTYILPSTSGVLNFGPNNHMGTCYSGKVVGFNGSYFLFGGLAGQNTSGGTPVTSNSLMMFQSNSEEWAYLNGAVWAASPPPHSNYVLQGEASPANQPESRSDFAMCIDDNGEIWMFGGDSRGSNLRRADLWKISTSPPTTWDGVSWSNGTPSDTMAAIIASNDSVPSSFTCEVLSIDAGRSLNIPKNETVTVTTMIKNNGNGINGKGKLVTMNGTLDEVEIIEDTLKIYSTLVVPAQAILRTNDQLHFKATSETEYSSVLDVGQIVGSVRSEVYLDLSTPGTDVRDYHLGVPLQGVEYASLPVGSATLISSNTNNGTIWNWMSSLAQWQAVGAGNLNNLTYPGEGIRVKAGTDVATNTTYLRSGPGVLSVEGSIVNTSTSLAIGYNTGVNGNANTFVLGKTTTSQQGWNLVANPFLANYDWSQHQKPLQLSHAMYVWNGETYDVYCNGVGTSSSVVAPWQAFWIQTTSSAAQVISFDEANRTEESSELRKTTFDGIELSVETSTGQKDHVYVGFDPQSTLSFDLEFDAHKFINSENSPTLAVEMDSVYYSINRVPNQSATTFPLYIEYSGSSDSLIFESDLSSLNSYGNAWLEDTKNGYWHPLGTTYEVEFTPADSNRFILQFINDVSTSEIEETNSPYAWIEGNRLWVEPNGAVDMKVQVMDVSGKLIVEYPSNTPYSTPRSTTLDTKGVYLVRMSWNNSAIVQRILF